MNTLVSLILALLVNGNGLNSIDKLLEFKTDSISVQLIKDARSGIATVEILKLKRKPYRGLNEDKISFLTMLGHYNYFHGKYDDALKNYFQALNECKERKVGIGIVLREIAKCYIKKEDYEKAYKFCLRACELDERLINNQKEVEQKVGTRELCSDYLILYKILLLQGKEKEAKEIEKKCIDLSKEIKDIERKKILCAIYGFGSQFYKDKKQDLSKEYKDKADSLAEEIKKYYDQKIKRMFE